MRYHNKRARAVHACVHAHSRVACVLVLAQALFVVVGSSPRPSSGGIAQRCRATAMAVAPPTFSAKPSQQNGTAGARPIRSDPSPQPLAGSLAPWTTYRNLQQGSSRGAERVQQEWFYVPCASLVGCPGRPPTTQPLAGFLGSAGDDARPPPSPWRVSLEAYTNVFSIMHQHVRVPGPPPRCLTSQGSRVGCDSRQASPVLWRVIVSTWRIRTCPQPLAGHAR